MMTHEPLVRKLTLFFNTFAALGYIDVSDIVQPPTNINLEAARKAGLSDEAISLIQRLPSLSGDLYNLSILPDGTLPVFYAEDNHLDWARRPTFQDEPEIPGTQFVLTNANIYGTAVIYDTETCRVMSRRPFDQHTDQVSLKVCYNSAQAHPPEQAIDDWIKNLITLRWLPYEDELIIDPDATEVEAATRHVDIVAQCQLQFVQRTMKECYVAAGWNPMASDLEGACLRFDSELFAVEKWKWVRRTQALLDRAYRDSWTWRAIREAIGGDLAASEEAKLLDVAMLEGWQPRHIEL